jgi:glycopeptide antibiotics resistance protein
VLLALAAFFIGFAGYGSLVPFDFTHIPLDRALEQFRSTPLVPLARASKSDFLTNVLLFVPIGFFLLGTLSGRSRRRAVLWLTPVAAFSLAYSAGIEFGQTFVAGRTPSWNDVLADTLGGVLGAGAWMVFGAAAVDWLGEARRSSSGADRALRLLGGYLALWLVLGLLPFDYTLRPQELAQKFRDGRILLKPFNGSDTVADTIGTVLMAVPIGVFGYLWGRHRQSTRPEVSGLAIVAAATTVVEGAQLLAMSRTADVTDLILSGGGGAVGVWVASRADRRVRVMAPSTGVRLWPVAALAAWCVLLAVRHWSPFDFVGDGQFVRARLALMFQVPFHSYYWGMPLFAFAEAASKFLLGMPVGALLQWMWFPASPRLRLAQAAAILCASGVLFTGVELGQLLVPSRVPDQTDVYIATAGAMAGLWAVRLVSAPRRMST